MLVQKLTNKNNYYSFIENSNQIEQYCLYETQFFSNSNYNNPYVDVSLTAHVSGPEGESFDIDGYWQGGNVWKLRIMPTTIGSWQYTTSSNDTGLNELSGGFECIAGSRPGILVVNPDYPYSFKLSGSAPFFLMGETSWYLMSNAVSYANGIFQKYINKRREQKFNAIHFVLGTGGFPQGTCNPNNEGGALWISQAEDRINPDFFNWVDKRMAYLDSVQMAVGFYFTWSQHFTTFTREQFERFERFLIARYAGYPLVHWIIVGEFDEAGAIADYNYHGQVIAMRDPYKHPISNHPDHADPKNLGTSRIFADQSWFSFIMQQLPQFPVYTSVAMVNQFIREDRSYNKPVLNSEFGYEDRIYEKKIMSADYVRKYAWAIVTGGGFLCYGHNETIKKVNLDALESKGATYMGHLYSFFQHVRWWQMHPDNNKVNSGFCLSDATPEYIIYLPDSGTVNVDLTLDSCAFQAQWYDPKTGTLLDTVAVNGGKVQPFTSIFKDDAVLHLWRYVEPSSNLNLSGIVSYFNEHRAISNALLELVNEKEIKRDTSDINGAFIFKNNPKGQVTLCVSKDNDHRDAITIYDALLLLEYLAFQVNLSDDQKLAADVTENGQVTGADVHAILRYLANFTDNVGSTGQWRFKPDTSTFFLNADTSINFNGFLLGDVDGNWAMNNENVSSINQPLQKPLTSQMNLGFGKITKINPQRISVPIKVTNVSQPLQALTISLEYDPDLLRYQYFGQTDLSERSMIAVNGEQPGRLHIAMTDLKGISTDGEIIAIFFDVSDKLIIDDCPSLKLTHVFFNGSSLTPVNQCPVYNRDKELTPIPDQLTVLQNYPNPFNTATTISFLLTFDAFVAINIFNANGQRQATIVNEKLTQGAHQIIWTAKNESGESLPSGIYFYQIRAQRVVAPNNKAYVINNKMLLIK